MRRSAVRLFLVGCAALVAVAAADGCTLLTSLDGLTGPAGDAAADGSDVLAIDAGSEGATGDAASGDGSMATDTGAHDAGPRVGSVYVFGGATDVATVSTVLAADAYADGTLGAWVPVASLPEARTYLEAVIGQGFVAVVGGQGPGGAYPTSTFLSAMQPAGLGGWTTSGQFALPRIRHGAALANGHIYVLGGTDPSDTALADVQVASVFATGIGTWAATSPLRVPRSRTAVASTEAFVYVFGGSDATSTAVADVYRSPINADGTLGAFEAQNSLPSPSTHEQATLVATHHILVTGGEGHDDVIVFDIDATLGTLGSPRSTLALPRKTDHHATVRLADHVYVIGGFEDNGTRLSDVMVGDLAADGSITRWTPTTSLPAPLAYHTAAAF